MDLLIIKLIAALLAAAIFFRADLRRRRLSLARTSGWHILTALDLLCPAATAGAAASFVVTLFAIVASQHVLPLWSPVTWAVAAGILILVVIWSGGKRQLQFQRPRGIVFGEWLILAPAYYFLEWA